MNNIYSIYTFGPITCPLNKTTAQDFISADCWNHIKATSCGCTCNLIFCHKILDTVLIKYLGSKVLHHLLTQQPVILPLHSNSMSGFECTLLLTCFIGVGLDVVRSPLHGSPHLLFQGQHVVLVLTNLQRHRLKVCALGEISMEILQPSLAYIMILFLKK